MLHAAIKTQQKGDKGRTGSLPHSWFCFSCIQNLSLDRAGVHYTCKRIHKGTQADTWTRPVPSYFREQKNGAQAKKGHLKIWLLVEKPGWPDGHVNSGEGESGSPLRASARSFQKRAFLNEQKVTEH